MNRRNFMQSILALGAAPAIVRAESIMRVKPLVATAGGLLVPEHLVGSVKRLIELQWPGYVNYDQRLLLSSNVAGIVIPILWGGGFGQETFRWSGRRTADGAEIWTPQAPAIQQEHQQ